MRKFLLIAIVGICSSPTLWGEVEDSAQNGFTVKIVTIIHASPTNVYAKLVHNVGDWWSSDHTFSGDARNLSIDEKPMGCFCEKLPKGGGVRHAEVISYDPGKTLVMSGALGPFQRLGVAGALSFTITPDGDGSKLETTYAVGGYLASGLDKWAAPCDAMLTQQTARLKSYVETGNLAPQGESKKP